LGLERLLIRRQVCRRTVRMSRTNRSPPTGYPGGNAGMRSKACHYQGTNKHKIMMNNCLLLHRCLRGCTIALGGHSYRIISVLRTRPATIGYARIIYAGTIPCLHPEPQVAQVLGLNGRRYLNLCHGWLQNGHKGVICAFAEVRRLGIAQGGNRWLRVCTNFPEIPSAKTAKRVSVPWRRRRNAAITTRASAGPLQKLDTEELDLFNAEVTG
jgi:hypothetical protein